MQATADPAKILVVEDDDHFATLLERILRDHGFGARVVRDGETGIASALEHRPDLVILDVVLPGRNGFDVIRELRRRGVGAPTLMLSGRSAVGDRVTGLDAGADDYLTKPFASDELLARIRALLRRAEDPGGTARITLGDLTLHGASRRAWRNGREINLTQREFSLLEYLLRNADTPVTRETIAREVWGQREVEETNLVDVYINYLRKKLESGGERPLLQTVRGVGYMLTPSPR